MRLDNGQVRWFDLDLPDVIELRRRFFTDTDRRRMLAASVLDPLLAEHFAGALLTLDTGGQAMARQVNRNDVVRSMGTKMTWVCEET